MRIKNDRCVSPVAPYSHRSAVIGARMTEFLDPAASSFLATRLFRFGSALADLELGIALTDHVDSSPSLNDLAIRVTVFQSTNAANHFHRIDLEDCFV